MSTTAQDGPPLQQLVRFCRELTLVDLPEGVVEHTRNAILDFLALTVSGATVDATQIAHATVREQGGVEQARIPGFGGSANVTQVALIAGIAGHIQDFDDTHIPTILHPTTPVLAAALPVAQWQGATGKELAEAYVIGVEAGARVALALGRAHYDRGWHVTGTAGPLAAAAAAARLLKLDPEVFANALGIAAIQAGGHREQFGWMTKSLHAGTAASSGVLSALLAARGYNSSPTSLTGRRGMLAVMSDSGDPAALSDGLWQRWELDRTGFKPYACGVVIHPALDAMIRLREHHRVTAEEIEGVQLRVHPLVQELTGKLEPQSGLEGKFSVTFAAAIALVDGAVGPAQFTDDAVRQTAVTEVQRRIETAVDESLHETQAVAEVRMRHGQTITERVEAAKGSPENPMTRDDIERKASQLVRPRLGQEGVTELIHLARQIEHLEDVSPLVDAACPGDPAEVLVRRRMSAAQRRR